MTQHLVEPGIPTESVVYRRRSPMRSGIPLGILTALALIFNAAGCGNERPAAVVSGLITYNGKPVEKGHISFFPVSGKGSTAGSPFENGRYRVDDVSFGEMEVRINAPKFLKKRKLYEKDPNSPVIDLFEEGLPERFNAKSELKLMVDKSNVQKDFELTK